MGFGEARRHGRHRIRRASAVFIALMSISAIGSVHSLWSLESKAPRPYLPTGPELTPVLTHLERRVSDAEADGHALSDFHATRVAPLMAALDTRMAVERTHLERIAIALIREGRATGIDPRLLVAVMLVENPWLDLQISSSAGAVGLMQVMPFHAGNWGCPGADLTDLDTNICHGTRILADALRRTSGDLSAALLKYNGCVLGTHTPDCHQYPEWVYSRAGADWMADISQAFPPRVVQAD
ncbi:MAG TPA: transglycosylase SLT domain-containing protein [Longimicrobiales bacterium]|nr:transglycosylase SLT domain-containing protein [Longimicrobiales bacterium]